MTHAVVRLGEAPWLGERPLADLLAVLDGDGEEACIAGGAVRDAVLGLPRGDIDIATTATPEIVMARAEAAGWKTAPTGIEHGTITVVIEGEPYEVTTLRRDVATDGRRAVVAFTRDWAEDAGRRDLTINGLYLDRAGFVHDLVGGVADLEAGRVRFIGAARDRIREDYLRTLRFFRFHARFGRGPLDAEGFSATIAEREGLARLSAERVRAELLKLLVAPRAAETVAAIAGAGLFAPLVGGAPRVRRLERLAALDAAAPDALLRLAGLFQYVVEDGERLARRLRLSNAEARRLVEIGDLVPEIDPSGGEAAARRALYRLGVQTYRDRVRLGWAAAGGVEADDDWEGLATLPDRWAAPATPITAARLVARGIEPGPKLGRALKIAEAAWVARDFPSDQRSIEALIDEAVAAVSRQPADQGDPA